MRECWLKRYRTKRVGGEPSNANRMVCIPSSRQSKSKEFACPEFILWVVFMWSSVVSFHGIPSRHDFQISLYAFCQIIGHISFNHSKKFFLRSELMSIVYFAFHNSPKSFHRTIIRTMGYSWHTLCHSCTNESLTEFFGRILILPVTMKNRLCSLFLMALSNVLSTSELSIPTNISNRMPVTQIQYNAQLYLSLVFVFVTTIFKPADISNPLPIWLVRRKFPIQYVFCYVHRVYSWFYAAVITMFYYRANLSFYSIYDGHVYHWHRYRNHAPVCYECIYTPCQDAPHGLALLFRLQVCYGHHFHCPVHFSIFGLLEPRRSYRPLITWALYFFTQKYTCSQEQSNSFAARE